jgi:peptidyl-prolyl cis-trans isomerase SurA
MKKLMLSLALFLFALTSAWSQTLFTYGKNNVSAKEFLNAYNKNKTEAGDKQSVLSYLDLYINFKLKVQAAKDQQLDTLPALQSDLENFRSQIEPNYLRNENSVNELIEEAFKRSQKDIEVIDFFLPANSIDAEQEAATISDVYTKLKNNPEEFLKNNSNIIKNDLGFITVFTLPYEIENIVYNLKVGEFSKPFKTANGWYIFKNNAERPAVGKVSVAQILFAFPPNAGDLIKEQKKKLADSVYNLLKNGADINELASQFSDDRKTSQEGGILPEFGVGIYSPAFEKAAFSLKDTGEISRPFETSFGFHILKLLSSNPVPTEETEDFKAYLKQQVLRDDRNETAKKIFISQITPKIGFKTADIDTGDLWKITDSFLLSEKKINAGNLSETSTLFSFNNNEKMTVEDWLTFVKSNNVQRQGNQSYKDLFDQFTSFAIIENYRKRLADFDPAYKSQIEEFKEGNLLFEIMQRKVWNHAAEDTVGLLNYFNENKEKYKWNKSADAIIFSAKDQKTAAGAIEKLKAGTNWKEIVGDDDLGVQADSSRFELKQLPVNVQENLSADIISEPQVNQNDNSVVFVQILKVYPENEPRNFEDARGLVINDYQNFLEQQWIAELKKEYPVKINDKVLKKVLKQAN